MAKARRTRTKRKRPRAAPAANDDAVIRAILTDIQQLERHREMEVRRRMRDVDKLATARKPANARQLAQARRRLDDAQLECLDVVQLGSDIEVIIELTRAQLAVLEVEMMAGMNAAMMRYVAARVKHGETAEFETVRTLLPRAFAIELAKAKYATAIAIADRNKMHDVLALLTVDPERAGEADEWRRELVVQEATVAHLKEGLRLLDANRPDRASLGLRRAAKPPRGAETQ